MPELPEVETVARQLAPLATGRRIVALALHDPKLAPERAPDVRGRTFGTVMRLGKQVVCELRAARVADAPLWLAVHLRMSGRLIHCDEAPAPATPHLRATLTLDRGAIVFIDPRRFGTMTWHAAPEEVAPAGLDPFDSRFTPRALGALVRGSRQQLKTWLLRQDQLVGIGNIYASEILNAARLSPFRAAGTLAPAEVKRLHHATRKILERAIACCGTTFSDFQDAHGVTGSFQNFLAVYGREGEPCRRCRGKVAREVQGQRSTYWCPRCAAFEGRHS